MPKPETKHYAELVVDQLLVENINQHPVKDLLHTDRPISARHLKVDNLFVKHRAQLRKPSVTNSDNVAAQSETRVEQIVYPDVVDQLVADQLIVDGSINGIDLATIQKFALRVDAVQEQQLVAQFRFVHLTAEEISVDENVVSNRPLINLIRTVGGPYSVPQDVSFEQPLLVNTLIAHEYINNIFINKEKLHVLQKRSARVQRVFGFKRLNAVTLRNPIVLQGKLTHSNLDRMSPLVTVPEDLVLSGDYVISGNVSIRQSLECANLFGATSTYNVNYLLDEGVSAQATQLPVSLEFLHPIKTQSLVVTNVNNMSPNDWVQFGKIQQVTGKKTFVHDLHIGEGFCDALTINGVQLARLNESVLQKSGDQTIEGNIYFRKITVKQ